MKLGPPNSSRAAALVIVVAMLIGLSAGAILFLTEPAPTPGGNTPAMPALTERPAPAPVEGASAPDFVLPDTTGKPLTLSALRGRPVIINFWATWCGPCAEEMPLLQQYYNRYKDDGLVLLAINESDLPEDIKTYATYFQLTFPILLDTNNDVSRLYRVRGLPTTFFVDRDGIIAWRRVGTLNRADLDYRLPILGLEK